ncbi:MAG TPA: hypothetical protein VIO85_07125 [Candidatus Dormibacteraeota bacterium]
MEAGPRRQARRPRQEQVNRPGWAAVAAAQPALPRLPGPTSAARQPAGPSWARLLEEPRRLGRQGSGRARPQAAPRWLRCLPDETPLLSAPVKAGALATRSFLAGAACV